MNTTGTEVVDLRRQIESAETLASLTRLIGTARPEPLQVPLDFSARVSRPLVEKR